MRPPAPSQISRLDALIRLVGRFIHAIVAQHFVQQVNAREEFQVQHGHAFFSRGRLSFTPFDVFHGAGTGIINLKVIDHSSVSLAPSFTAQTKNNSNESNVETMQTYGKYHRTSSRGADMFYLGAERLTRYWQVTSRDMDLKV